MNSGSSFLQRKRKMLPYASTENLATDRTSNGGDGNSSSFQNSPSSTIFDTFLKNTQMNIHFSPSMLTSGATGRTPLAPLNVNSVHTPCSEMKHMKLSPQIDSWVIRSSPQSSMTAHKSSKRARSSFLPPPAFSPPGPQIIDEETRASFVDAAQTFDQADILFSSPINDCNDASSGYGSQSTELFISPSRSMASLMVETSSSTTSLTSRGQRKLDTDEDLTTSFLAKRLRHCQSECSIASNKENIAPPANSSFHLSPLTSNVDDNANCGYITVSSTTTTSTTITRTPGACSLGGFAELTTSSSSSYDISPEKLLRPVMFSHGDSAKCIDVATLTELLHGTHTASDKIKHLCVIDCRYPYEYEGGHIRGALNIFNVDELISSFLGNGADSNGSIPPPGSETVLIFHCEFSSKRGPAMMRALRREERKNWFKSETLRFPECYLLKGGYKDFHEYCQRTNNTADCTTGAPNDQLCVPNAYLPMTANMRLAEFHGTQSGVPITKGGGRSKKKPTRQRLASFGTPQLDTTANHCGIALNRTQSMVNPTTKNLFPDDD